MEPRKLLFTRHHHSLVQTHQTVNAIETLTAICHPLLSRKNYPVGAHHLPQLLRLCVYQLTLHALEWRPQWWLTLVSPHRSTLPGIDANDRRKTMATYAFYAGKRICV